MGINVLTMTPHKRRTIITAVAAVAAAVIIIYLWLFDPVQAPAPQCTFRRLTGYDCPGCGSQRAIHALLNGDISAAWGYNPFIFFAVPAAAFLLAVEARRQQWPRLHHAAFHPATIAAIAAAIIIYWFARNL